MKRIFLCFLILSIFVSVNLFRKYIIRNVEAAVNGSWVFVDKKMIVKSLDSAPFSSEISGIDGKRILKSKYEYQNMKEYAVIEWGWTVPLKEIFPGSTFEMALTGRIKEWKTTHFFSGTMYARIQKFGVCPCEAGTDLGFIGIDYYSGDEVGRLKTIKKSGIIPNFGELDSKTTNRFQISIKLTQNGADYQWIYVYQWKETANSQKIKIELKVGSKIALVNGISKSLDSAPFITNNRTFVPFRFLGESFGAKVGFTTNPSSKLVETVLYSLNNLSILLYINKQEALVNNKKIQLDTPPIIKNNRVMVPVRFVSENLMAEVDWNPTTQTIKIRK